MTLIDYILLGIILLIAGFAGWYIYRSKKCGKKCIGCPDSGACAGKCSGCCGCSIRNQE